MAQLLIDCSVASHSTLTIRDKFKFSFHIAKISVEQIIRIINGCEVWIENSVMRVNVQHHEAC